ncbi:MAG: hypothetical protein EP340_06205 [Alphaproteobacteria bacterium]|nr:MAG: hypothetical protein EP340_06205 [Alphaproteobacteria bacterium]
MANPSKFGISLVAFAAISLVGGCDQVAQSPQSIEAERSEHEASVGKTEADQPMLVQFSNTCSAQVQDDLNTGITLLHSFEYPETLRVFSNITTTDPSCAIAKWGIAMSLWHPLWAPPSNADLDLGASLLDEAIAMEASPREKAYLGALQEFYSSNDPQSHRQRVLRYEAAMDSLQSNYPDDVEAKIFHALALLATADPHDKTYSVQNRAGKALKEIGRQYPTHPGVLHYIIHSYDYPGLAQNALEEAKTYAKAAPDSAHAQHMPSHIFTRLGLWELSLASNHDSTKSAEEYTVTANLPGLYDEGLHSIDYLMYAMLQTGRDAEAAELLKKIQGIEHAYPENFKVAFTFASSPSRYALERRQWVEASELELIHADFPWDNFLWAKSIHHFTKGIGAARSGQPDTALQELETLRKIRDDLPPATLPYWREEVDVQIDALNSWIEAGKGNEQAAIALAEKAADKEDAVDKHPVTPGEVLPARELLADLLFEFGHHEAALEAYRTVLKSSPNRLNALIGAEKAARELGNSDLADDYKNTIIEQIQYGDREIRI